jgi:RNA polymerase sigma-70 factor (ECF subfamily)
MIGGTDKADISGYPCPMAEADWTDRLLASQKRLWHWFRRKVADEHDCDDLTQETLIAAWQGRQSFRGTSSLDTWLHGIAKHRLYGYYRQRGALRRGNSPLESLDRLPCPVRTQDEERLALDLLATRLGRADAELYRLFYAEKMSIRELARSLQLAEGTVKYRLFAIRRALLAASKIHRPWIPCDT